MPSRTVTRLSSKGQIVIPKPVREAHGWAAGTEFLVEDEGDRVVLRPRRRGPGVAVEEVLGCTGYRGPRRSLAEMEEAIARGVQER